MLRITRNADADAVTLKLEGSLREPWVAEVRLALGCEADVRIALDLADVHFVDEAGLILLRELTDVRGVRLAKCSNFVAELLHHG